MNPLHVISIDTEWGYRDGRVGWVSAFVPVVAYAVLSGREYIFPPGEVGCLGAFIDAHRDALYVAHNAAAEMKYLFHLGIIPPPRWFDTFITERWLTNSSNRLEAGLAKSMMRRNLGHLVPLEKTEFRDSILHLRLDLNDLAVMDSIARYCLGDCHAAAALYQAQRSDPRMDAAFDQFMAAWAAYQLVAAKIEIRGIPFDVDRY